MRPGMAVAECTDVSKGVFYRYEFNFFKKNMLFVCPTKAT